MRGKEKLIHSRNVHVGYLDGRIENIYPVAGVKLSLLKRRLTAETFRAQEITNDLVRYFSSRERRTLEDCER